MHTFFLNNKVPPTCGDPCMYRFQLVFFAKYEYISFISIFINILSYSHMYLYAHIFIASRNIPTNSQHSIINSYKIQFLMFFHDCLKLANIFLLAQCQLVACFSFYFYSLFKTSDLENDYLSCLSIGWACVCGKCTCSTKTGKKDTHSTRTERNLGLRRQHL